MKYFKTHLVIVFLCVVFAGSSNLVHFYSYEQQSKLPGASIVKTQGEFRIQVTKTSDTEYTTQLWVESFAFSSPEEDFTIELFEEDSLSLSFIYFFDENLVVSIPEFFVLDVPQNYNEEMMRTLIDGVKSFVILTNNTAGDKVITKEKRKKVTVKGYDLTHAKNAHVLYCDLETEIRRNGGAVVTVQSSTIPRDCVKKPEYEDVASLALGGKYPPESYTRATKKPKQMEPNGKYKVVKSWNNGVLQTAKYNQKAEFLLAKLQNDPEKRALLNKHHYLQLTGSVELLRSEERGEFQDPENDLPRRSDLLSSHIDSPLRISFADDVLRSIHGFEVRRAVWKNDYFSDEDILEFLEEVVDKNEDNAARLSQEMENLFLDISNERGQQVLEYICSPSAGSFEAKMMRGVISGLSRVRQLHDNLDAVLRNCILMQDYIAPGARILALKSLRVSVENVEAVYSLRNLDFFDKNQGMQLLAHMISVLDSKDYPIVGEVTEHLMTNLVEGNIVKDSMTALVEMGVPDLIDIILEFLENSEVLEHELVAVETLSRDSVYALAPERVREVLLEYLFDDVALLRWFAFLGLLENDPAGSLTDLVQATYRENDYPPLNAYLPMKSLLQKHGLYRSVPVCGESQGQCARRMMVDDLFVLGTYIEDPEDPLSTNEVGLCKEPLSFKIGPPDIHIGIELETCNKLGMKTYSERFPTFSVFLHDQLRIFLALDVLGVKDFDLFAIGFHLDFDTAELTEGIFGRRSFQTIYAAPGGDPSYSTRYSMYDPLWSEEMTVGSLSEESMKVKNSGAELVCYTMALNAFPDEFEIKIDGEDVNPSNLNAYLKINGGYDSSGNILWSAFTEFGIVPMEIETFEDVKKLSENFREELAFGLSEVAGFAVVSYVNDTSGTGETKYGLAIPSSAGQTEVDDSQLLIIVPEDGQEIIVTMPSDDSDYTFQKAIWLKYDINYYDRECPPGMKIYSEDSEICAARSEDYHFISSWTPDQSLVGTPCVMESSTTYPKFERRKHCSGAAVGLCEALFSDGSDEHNQMCSQWGDFIDFSNKPGHCSQNLKQKMDDYMEYLHGEADALEWGASFAEFWEKLLFETGVWFVGGAFDKLDYFGRIEGSSKVNYRVEKTIKFIRDLAVAAEGRCCKCVYVAIKDGGDNYEEPPVIFSEGYGRSECDVFYDSEELEHVPEFFRYNLRQFCRSKVPSQSELNYILNGLSSRSYGQVFPMHSKAYEKVLKLNADYSRAMSTFSASDLLLTPSLYQQYKTVKEAYQMKFEMEFADNIVSLFERGFLKWQQDTEQNCADTPLPFFNFLMKTTKKVHSSYFRHLGGKFHKCLSNGYTLTVRNGWWMKFVGISFVGFIPKIGHILVSEPFIAADSACDKLFGEAYMECKGYMDSGSSLGYVESHIDTREPIEFYQTILELPDNLEWFSKKKKSDDGDGSEEKPPPLERRKKPGVCDKYTKTDVGDPVPEKETECEYEKGKGPFFSLEVVYPVYPPLDIGFQVACEWGLELGLEASFTLADLNLVTALVQGLAITFQANGFLQISGLRGGVGMECNIFSAIVKEIFEFDFTQSPVEFNFYMSLEPEALSFEFYVYAEYLWAKMCKGLFDILYPCFPPEKDWRELVKYPVFSLDGVVNSLVDAILKGNDVIDDDGYELKWLLSGTNPGLVGGPEPVAHDKTLRFTEMNTRSIILTASDDETPNHEIEYRILGSDNKDSEQIPDYLHVYGPTSEFGLTVFDFFDIDLDCYTGVLYATPLEYVYGTFALYYRAYDGELQSDPAKLTIEVIPQPNMPILYTELLPEDDKSIRESPLIPNEDTYFEIYVNASATGKYFHAEYLTIKIENVDPAMKINAYQVDENNAFVRDIALAATENVEEVVLYEVQGSRGVSGIIANFTLPLNEYYGIDGESTGRNLIVKAETSIDGYVTYASETINVKIQPVNDPIRVTLTKNGAPDENPAITSERTSIHLRGIVEDPDVITAGEIVCSIESVNRKGLIWVNVHGDPNYFFLDGTWNQQHRVKFRTSFQNVHDTTSPFRYNPTSCEVIGCNAHDIVNFTCCDKGRWGLGQEYCSTSTLPIYINHRGENPYMVSYEGSDDPELFPKITGDEPKETFIEIFADRFVVFLKFDSQTAEVLSNSAADFVVESSTTSNTAVVLWNNDDFTVAIKDMDNAADLREDYIFKFTLNFTIKTTINICAQILYVEMCNSISRNKCAEHVLLFEKDTTIRAIDDLDLDARRADGSLHDFIYLEGEEKGVYQLPDKNLEVSDPNWWLGVVEDQERTLRFKFPYEWGYHFVWAYAAKGHFEMELGDQLYQQKHWRSVGWVGSDNLPHRNGDMVDDETRVLEFTYKYTEEISCFDTLYVTGAHTGVWDEFVLNSSIIGGPHFRLNDTTFEGVPVDGSGHDIADYFESDPKWSGQPVVFHSFQPIPILVKRVNDPPTFPNEWEEYEVWNTKEDSPIKLVPNDYAIEDPDINGGIGKLEVRAYFSTVYWNIGDDSAGISSIVVHKNETSVGSRGGLDQYMVLTGVFEHVNELLQRMYLLPRIGSCEKAQVDLEFSDLGNTGDEVPKVAQTAKQSLMYEVFNVKDDPVLRNPQSMKIREEESVILEGFSLYDPDFCMNDPSRASKRSWQYSFREDEEPEDPNIVVKMICCKCQWKHEYVYDELSRCVDHFNVPPGKNNLRYDYTFKVEIVDLPNAQIPAIYEDYCRTEVDHDLPAGEWDYFKRTIPHKSSFDEYLENGNAFGLVITGFANMECINALLEKVEYEALPFEKGWDHIYFEATTQYPGWNLNVDDNVRKGVFAEIGEDKVITRINSGGFDSRVTRVFIQPEPFNVLEFSVFGHKNEGQLELSRSGDLQTYPLMMDFLPYDFTQMHKLIVSTDSDDIVFNIVNEDPVFGGRPLLHNFSPEGSTREYTERFFGNITFSVKPYAWGSYTVRFVLKCIEPLDGSEYQESVFVTFVIDRSLVKPLAKIGDFSKHGTENVDTILDDVVTIVDIDSNNYNLYVHFGFENVQGVLDLFAPEDFEVFFGMNHIYKFQGEWKKYTVAKLNEHFRRLRIRPPRHFTGRVTLRVHLVRVEASGELERIVRIPLFFKNVHTSLKLSLIGEEPTDVYAAKTSIGVTTTYGFNVEDWDLRERVRIEFYCSGVEVGGVFNFPRLFELTSEEMVNVSIIESSWYDVSLNSSRQAFKEATTEEILEFLDGNNGTTAFSFGAPMEMANWIIEEVEYTPHHGGTNVISMRSHDGVEQLTFNALVDVDDVPQEPTLQVHVQYDYDILEFQSTYKIETVITGEATLYGSLRIICEEEFYNETSEELLYVQHCIGPGEFWFDWNDIAPDGDFVRMRIVQSRTVADVLNEIVIEGELQYLNEFFGVAVLSIARQYDVQRIICITWSFLDLEKRICLNEYQDVTTPRLSGDGDATVLQKVSVYDEVFPIGVELFVNNSLYVKEWSCHSIEVNVNKWPQEDVKVDHRIIEFHNVPFEWSMIFPGRTRTCRFVNGCTLSFFVRRLSNTTTQNNFGIRDRVSVRICSSQTVGNSHVGTDSAKPMYVVARVNFVDGSSASVTSSAFSVIVDRTVPPVTFLGTKRTIVRESSSQIFELDIKADVGSTYSASETPGEEESIVCWTYAVEENFGDFEKEDYSSTYSQRCDEYSYAIDFLEDSFANSNRTIFEDLVIKRIRNPFEVLDPESDEVLIFERNSDRMVGTVSFHLLATAIVPSNDYHDDLVKTFHHEYLIDVKPSFSEVIFEAHPPYVSKPEEYGVLIQLKTGFKYQAQGIITDERVVVEISGTEHIYAINGILVTQPVHNLNEFLSHDMMYDLEDGMVYIDVEFSPYPNYFGATTVYFSVYSVEESLGASKPYQYSVDIEWTSVYDATEIVAPALVTSTWNSKKTVGDLFILNNDDVNDFDPCKYDLRVEALSVSSPIELSIEGASVENGIYLLEEATIHEVNEALSNLAFAASWPYLDNKLSIAVTDLVGCVGHGENADDYVRSTEVLIDTYTIPFNKKVKIAEISEGFTLLETTSTAEVLANVHTAKIQLKLKDIDAGLASVGVTEFAQTYDVVLSFEHSKCVFIDGSVDTLSFSGNLETVNEALSNIWVRGQMNKNGDDVILITITDKAWHPSQNDKIVEAEIPISITPVNTPPVLDVGRDPFEVITVAGGVKTVDIFSQMSISDVDFCEQKPDEMTWCFIVDLFALGTDCEGEFSFEGPDVIHGTVHIAHIRKDGQYYLRVYTNDLVYVNDVVIPSLRFNAAGGEYYGHCTFEAVLHDRVNAPVKNFIGSVWFMARDVFPLIFRNDIEINSAVERVPVEIFRGQTFTLGDGNEELLADLSGNIPPKTGDNVYLDFNREERVVFKIDSICYNGEIVCPRWKSVIPQYDTSSDGTVYIWNDKQFTMIGPNGKVAGINEYLANGAVTVSPHENVSFRVMLETQLKNDAGESIIISSNLLYYDVKVKTPSVIGPASGALAVDEPTSEESRSYVDLDVTLDSYGGEYLYNLKITCETICRFWYLGTIYSHEEGEEGNLPIVFSAHTLSQINDELAEIRVGGDILHVNGADTIKVDIWSVDGSEFGAVDFHLEIPLTIISVNTPPEIHIEKEVYTIYDPLLMDFVSFHDSDADEPCKRQILNGFDICKAYVIMSCELSNDGIAHNTHVMKTAEEADCFFVWTELAPNGNPLPTILGDDYGDGSKVFGHHNNNGFNMVVLWAEHRYLDELFDELKFVPTVYGLYSIRITYFDGYDLGEAVTVWVNYPQLDRIPYWSITGSIAKEFIDLNYNEIDYVVLDGVGLQLDPVLVAKGEPVYLQVSLDDPGHRSRLYFEDMTSCETGNTITGLTHLKECPAYFHACNFEIVSTVDDTDSVDEYPNTGPPDYIIEGTIKGSFEDIQGFLDNCLRVSMEWTKSSRPDSSPAVEMCMQAWTAQEISDDGGVLSRRGDEYCIHGGVSYLDRKCYVVGEGTMNWANANDACENQFGDHATLALAKNPDEYHVLSSLATEMTSSTSFPYVYIGYTDSTELISTASEGIWKGVDGKVMDNFGQWHSGEPNNYNEAEHCAIIHITHGEYNVNYYCNGNINFICEYFIDDGDKNVIEYKSYRRCINLYFHRLSWVGWDDDISALKGNCQSSVTTGMVSISAPLVLVLIISIVLNVVCCIGMDTVASRKVRDVIMYWKGEKFEVSFNDTRTKLVCGGGSIHLDGKKYLYEEIEALKRAHHSFKLVMVASDDLVFEVLGDVDNSNRFEDYVMKKMLELHPAQTRDQDIELETLDDDIEGAQKAQAQDDGDVSKDTPFMTLRREYHEKHVTVHDEHIALPDAEGTDGDSRVNMNDISSVHARVDGSLRIATVSGMSYVIATKQGCNKFKLALLDRLKK